MRDKQTLLIALSFIFFLSSCEMFNPEEPVPAYITIDKIDFKAGYKEGTDSADIRDAWVYLDEDLVGAFELPAKFPIITEGKQKLTVIPGVVLNGINATRAACPFMERFDHTIELQPEEVYDLGSEINLTSSYKDAVEFPWDDDTGQEGFEDTGISIDSVANSDVKVIKSKEDVYEGAFSGLIHMTTASPNFLGASKKEFDVITGNRPVFLEIHIKNPDHALEIGFYENYSGGSVTKSSYIVINPGAEWKKMYINLTPHMPTIASASSYKIYFQTTLNDGATEGKIFLDNIKLIHL